MRAYTETLIEQIWNKAIVVEGYDSTRWRKDFAGAWIQRDQYGIQSVYGWEIDHVRPVAAGGTDDITNLNPIQWENNRSKGADYPVFQTVVTSNENRNVHIVKKWKIS